MALRSRFEDTILAGTRGYYAPDPGEYGELTVCPAEGCKTLPARRGYRWVCKTPQGHVVFIPFRDFIPLSEYQNSDKRSE